MPTLLELQDAMRAQLFAPVPPADGGGAVGHILGDGIAPASRLQVHHNHIRITLTDALAGIYSAVEAMVGIQFFRAAAHGFIAEGPPCDPVLYAYGDGFADFLAAFPSAASLPYLPDLARLEWAMHRSFHAADESALTAGALGAVPADALADLVLRPRADAGLVASDWPVDALWHATRAPESGALERIDLVAAGGAAILLLRQGYDVRMWHVPAGEWHWLAAFAAGQDMAGAAAAATAADPAFDLADALSTNLQRGTFAALEAPQELKNKETTR